MVKTIRNDVEEYVLTTLSKPESEILNMSLLEIKFSQLPCTPPTDEAFNRSIDTIINDKNGVLLYGSRGDLLLQWNGDTGKILQQLEQLVIDYCTSKECTELAADFFQYYNYYVDSEQLRSLFEARVKQRSDDATPAKPANAVLYSLEFTPEQQICFNKARLARRTRVKPEILIVEDLVMSQKIITKVLADSGTCHVAATGSEAMASYAEYAPDIVFLDIELPDSNGHELAHLFRKSDPDVHLVMVTSNNYRKDVTQAKANLVQGFIAKPYTKEKLLDSMTSYQKMKGKRWLLT